MVYFFRYAGYNKPYSKISSLENRFPMRQSREQQFGIAAILPGELVIDSVCSDIRRTEDNRVIRLNEKRKLTIEPLPHIFEFLRKHQ